MYFTVGLQNNLTTFARIKKLEKSLKCVLKRQCHKIVDNFYFMIRTDLD